MTHQELRRKQVEEIVKQYHNNKGRCNCHDGEKCWPCSLTEAILSLLSDAERKVAWAVVEAVRQVCCEGKKIRCDKCECGKKSYDAARQVASSFGPDPEGEGK